MSKKITYEGKIFLTVENGKEDKLNIEFDDIDLENYHKLIPAIYDLLKSIHIKHSLVHWRAE